MKHHYEKLKPLTKWQEYAKLKNINNVNKIRLVFIRANDDTQDWLIEVPGNDADPNEAFFAKRIEAKSERKNKNELQCLRNIARSKNGKEAFHWFQTINQINSMQVTRHFSRFSFYLAYL